MNKGKKKYKTITGRYFYERPDQGIRNLFSVIIGVFITIPVYLFGAYTNNSEYTVETQAQEQAVEIQVEQTPTPEPTKEPTIEEYIIEVFGEDSDEALKIATCESGLKQETVGDTNIMLYDSKWDEMVGDSIGIFQVRTGGTGWNRARANGFSADQFRTKLKEYKYNIDYAKTIFDQRGWTAWYLCSQRAL